jgi:hypothetical protein
LCTNITVSPITVAHVGDVGLRNLIGVPESKSFDCYKKYSVLGVLTTIIPAPTLISIAGLAIVKIAQSIGNRYIFGLLL